MRRSLLPALLLAAACNAGRDATPAADRVTQLADRYVAAYFDAFPHAATLAGAADGPHDRLPDLSAERRERWHATEDSILAALEAIPAADLPAGSAAAVTHGFLTELVRNSVGYRVCRMELWNVSPTWTGWQQELASLAGSQPVGDSAKGAAAARRFAGLSQYVDQEIANLREGIRLGYTAPKGNVLRVIDQMQALLAAPVEQSPFVAMAPDTARAFRERMAAIESSGIRPAIRRYLAFLQQDYLRAARDDVGVAANPNGAQCYAAAVKYHATVAVPAEEVHRIGLAQMDSIRAEMQAIASRSFGTSDVAAALRLLRTDRRYLFASRADKLRVAQEALERAKAALPRYFAQVPRADVVIQPVAAFAEPSAPDGFYNNPAEDGSRPGIYYINLRGAETTPRAGLESTAFHETYPGHHMQSALALERKELHPVQRYLYLSGFSEGWALYTERLAAEMGLFSGDVDRFGQLSNDALRAARLVVDAGMHALGWTRQQAIDYMLANTAESPESVASEVDRYIAVPGQATSYMLGALEIRRLRAEAQRRMGDRFDIKAFHTAVLEDGSVPLAMLRQKVERWSQP